MPARIEGDEVVVEAPDGPLRFSRAAIRDLIPGIGDQAEWSEKQASALRGGAQERFAAAWWAIEHGLTAEAESMLRSAHSADSRHQPTARLIALLDRLNAPCPEPDNLDATRRSLPGRFETEQGPHIVLFHQATAPEARERVELLERVLKTFYLSLTANGLDLRAPSVRLVSVWFADQKDYLAHLRAEGATAFLTTQGYYHPTRGIVFSYDARSEPTYRRRQHDADSAPKRERERRMLLLDLDRRTQELGTTAHEVTHQLVRASDLAPRFETLPIWLHEGLAMQFEVVRGGRWAGVGRIDPDRLKAWRAASGAPELTPLIRDSGFGRGFDRRRYATAWALVYFLRKEHPVQFYAWLDQLRAPAAGVEPAGLRAERAFQSSFGSDLTQLQTDWRRYIDGLRLPGETAP